MNVRDKVEQFHVLKMKKMKKETFNLINNMGKKLTNEKTPSTKLKDQFRYIKIQLVTGA